MRRVEFYRGLVSPGCGVLELGFWDDGFRIRFMVLGLRFRFQLAPGILAPLGYRWIRVKGMRWPVHSWQ